MKILPDSISKLIYESSDDSSPQPTTPTLLNINTNTLLPPNSSCIVPLDKLSNNQIYMGIYNKTCQDNCPNLRKYRDMVKILGPSIPDLTTRGKAALAASGVTALAILDEIVGLRNTLAEETTRGKQHLDDVEKTTTTRGDADTLEKEIAEKQKRLVELNATIAEANDKVQRKRSEFCAAIIRRTGELEDLTKEINNLK